jgi:hypothetical protein
MSVNRQFLQQAQALTDLHLGIALAQASIRALDTDADHLGRWNGRSIFGMESLCSDTRSLASLIIHGAHTRAVEVDHTDVHGNRRQLLFAINAVSQETGVVAHPSLSDFGQLVINLVHHSSQAVELSVQTDDPTEYFSNRGYSSVHVIGGVILTSDSAHGSLPSRVFKRRRFGAESHQSLDITLPCQPQESIGHLQRMLLKLSLQHGLLGLS